MPDLLSIQSKIGLLAVLCPLSIVTMLVRASIDQSECSAERVKSSCSQMLEVSAVQSMPPSGKLQMARIQRYGMGNVSEILAFLRNDNVVRISAHRDRSFR